MKLSLVIFSGVAIAHAFNVPTPLGNKRIPQLPQDSNLVENSADQPKTVGVSLVPMATAAFWALTSSSAMAAGPDWGIFEGKTLSLLHPVMMASMLGLSVSTALLGFDWRRQRTIGGEISDLKKTLPSLGGASSVAEAISAAEAAEDMALVVKLKAAMPIEAQIKELQDTRKALAEKDSKDKHFKQGSLLVLLGTVFAIEVSHRIFVQTFIRGMSHFLFLTWFVRLPSKGPLNTYARTGKLFPGPHLYAGAGLVCLWALAAACVPAMQKGDETARTVHIGANLTGIAFFVWQVQSGIPILLKVIEKAPWP